MGKCIIFFIYTQMGIRSMPRLWDHCLKYAKHCIMIACDAHTHSHTSFCFYSCRQIWITVVLFAHSVQRHSIFFCNHIARLHKNDPRFIVYCQIGNCGFSSKSWIGYKSHISRKHLLSRN